MLVRLRNIYRVQNLPNLKDDSARSCCMILFFISMDLALILIGDSRRVWFCTFCVLVNVRRCEESLACIQTRRCV